MSVITYQAFALLDPENNFTMDEAAKRFAEKLSGLKLAFKGSTILLSSNNWKISINLSSDSWVLEESQEIAAVLTDSPRGQDIAKCASRVEVVSNSPDPNMDHFNDYIIVCEVLESFRGVILVDPQIPALI